MLRDQLKHPLRFVSYFVLLTMVLGCMACTDVGRMGSDRKRAEWKIGYWYWQGPGRVDTGTAGKEPVPIDLLYVHAGDRTVNPHAKQEPVNMIWSERLPKADAYIAVLRYEGSGLIGENIIPNLTRSYESLKRRVAEKGQRVAGLQIDYDCPTRDLERYSRFLRDLRKALPEENLLSITALLDWFGPGTRVSDVIRWTDEFVPQFYDVDPGKTVAADGGLAEPIDPARWAPIFNGQRKPYRIGIASFGRIVEIRKTPDTRSSSQNSAKVTIRGESPLEIMVQDKGIFVRHGSSAAGEIIAHFRGGSNEMIKMVVPTHQSVSAAYNAAKAMGGFCSGVIFFRHPIGSEALALSPAEISRIISGKGAPLEATAAEADDGFCGATSCSDLFVRLKDRFPSKDVVLALRSSQDVEYFLPDRSVKARLRGPRLIEVTIPAYAGAPRIPVGRAVSRDPVRFVVEEKS
jgi:hypothetical protein